MFFDSLIKLFAAARSPLMLGWHKGVSARLMMIIGVYCISFVCEQG